jgi:hypothetical protein
MKITFQSIYIKRQEMFSIAFAENNKLIEKYGFNVGSHSRKTL